MFGPEAADPPPLHARRHDRQQLLRRDRPGATARPSTTSRRLEVLTYDGDAVVGRADHRRGVRRASSPRAAAAPRSTGGCAAPRRRTWRRSAPGYPHIPRRVSGYNLDSLLPENGFDVARALVGSEGTLVTVLHAELELVPVPDGQAPWSCSATPTSPPPADAVPRDRCRTQPDGSWRAWTSG